MTLLASMVLEELLAGLGGRLVLVVSLLLVLAWLYRKGWRLLVGLFAGLAVYLAGEVYRYVFAATLLAIPYLAFLALMALVNGQNAGLFIVLAIIDTAAAIVLATGYQYFILHRKDGQR